VRVLRRLLVTVATLAVLLVVADRVVDHQLEAGVAEGVASADGVVSGTGADGEAGAVSVDIDGFPVLTQLAAGRLDALDITIPGYQAATGEVSVLITDIRADVRGVTTSEPYVARSLTASGVFGADSLTAAINAVGVPGDVSVDADGLSFSGTVLGRDASARLSIAVDQGGRGISLVPESMSIGGQDVPLADDGLDSLLSASVPLDALPEGLSLQSVTPADGQLVATLVGADVDLSAMTAPPSS